LGAQVFDVHLLLHVLDGDEALLQSMSHLHDNAVEQTQFQIQKAVVMPGRPVSGNDRPCVELRERSQAVRMLT
jgi:hypothetical protein